jgi:uncharacterized protein Yka (UPF0111/DUF47 family)
MPGTDFFDDDLIRQRDAPKRIKMPGPAGEPVETIGDGVPLDEGPSSRPVSELNLTRMARHRQQVDAQASTAIQEIERLKKRQEQLEHEKRELEEFRRKHDEFDRGKREMLDHLRRNLVTLERREVEAGRLAELLGATRKRFKSILEELETIDPESWPEDQIRDELNRNLGIIEDARMEYNKALAKIDAVKGEERVPAASSASSPVLFEEASAAAVQERPLGYWIKVGFAVSLPVVMTVVILAIFFFVAQSNGWF